MLSSWRFSSSRYTENTVNLVRREIRSGIFSRSASRSSTELTSRASSARMARSSASEAPGEWPNPERPAVWPEAELPEVEGLLDGRVSTCSQSVLRHPVVDPLHSILLVVVLLDAVAFARVEHELGRLASILQAAIQLVGLAHRHAFVVGAMQNQRRRRHLVDVRHRRSIQIQRQR